MLQIFNLTKKYQTKVGDLAALDNLSLTLPDNGLVFITGKSGSGKTTLLNTVGGLDDFDGGDIAINGQYFSSFSTADFAGYRNTVIGFVFQEYNLIPDYTVEKNIKIATELQGENYDQNRINELLELVDLKGLNKRKPNELSGGQKQRVAIARALIKNPKIIMADEPTGALDQATGISVMQTLKKLSKEKLVIVVSHDLEIAETFADRIIRLVDGKLSEDVTIIEKQAKSSVTVSDDNVYVKKDADLSEKDTACLSKAIKEQKRIYYIDNEKIRTKVSTSSLLENEQENKSKDLDYNEDFSGLQSQLDKKEKKKNFVRSKMKTTSSMWLGVRSLKVKPLRLIFTIFFSVLAFTLFGVFDSLSRFDKMKSIALLLEENNYPTITASATYADKEVNSFVRVDQTVIDNINNKTGYNFRGLYEIYDNNPLGMGGLNDIIEPKINYDLPVGKYYYQTYLNDFIEFSFNEVSNGEKTRYDEQFDESPTKWGTKNATIDKDGFNLKVIYGEYPKAPEKFQQTDQYGHPIVDENREDVYDYEEKSFYDVAISKYTAESILYWLKVNNIKSYRFQDEDGNYNLNAQSISSIEDLINVPIKLSSKQRFFIRAIIDTGDIPEKYDSLKNVAPTGTVNPLAQDLATYLHSSLNFKLFVPEGYVNTYRTFYNRATKYFANNNEYTLNGKGLIGDTSTHYSFYNAFDYLDNSSELESENIIIFSPSVTKLREHDIIINIKDFSNFYWQEIEDLTVQPQELKILNHLSYLNKDEYLSSVNSLVKKIGFNKILKQTTISRQVKDSSTVEQFNCRIVGVYFGIDKDIKLPLNGTDESIHDPYPIMMTPSFMTSLGIYNKQGEFSRMVSPSNTGKNDPTALSSIFCSNQGVKVVWYGNTQLNNLENNQHSLDSLTNVVFYLSLVLAAFSVYMIFNYISVSISSRKQSVGILRALGSKSYDIATIFITEGLIISVINGILACLTAFFGCMLVNLYANLALGFVMKFAFYTPRQVLIIIGATLFTGILACAIPIIKICRKKPVDLIRKP